MTKKRGELQVTRENDTGRNTHFQNRPFGRERSRAEVVRIIEQGGFPRYYTRKINGVKTPVSNPDGNKKNNLG